MVEALQNKISSSVSQLIKKNSLNQTIATMCFSLSMWSKTRFKVYQKLNNTRQSGSILIFMRTWPRRVLSMHPTKKISLTKYLKSKGWTLRGVSSASE